MEWISTWIMQLAGIVVVGAICDLILVEGEMKKYVKLITGLVLMLTVICPIINISSTTLLPEFPASERVKAMELKNRLDEKEMNKIFEIYREKLEQNIENQIYNSFEIESEASVDVEENDEKSFGNIVRMEIIVENSDKVSVDEIKRLLSQKFEISKECIDVQRK